MAVRLDDIDYFLAVVKYGQVRRAALELEVSQPALSKGIQRLERELGFPLFERTSKGMVLTPVAEQFHERTRALRTGLGEAIKEAADLHLGAMGVLRVGVSPLYAQRLFAPACLQLHRQRPAARIQVDVNLGDALLTALRRGDVDLCINALPHAIPDDLQASPLIDDDLCMVVRGGHPLLSRRRLRLPDLVDFEWMLPGPGVAGRRSVEGRFAEAGLPPPRVAIEVSNSATQLTGILQQSDLIAIASEAGLAGQSDPLVVLPMADARFHRRIGALTRRDAPLPPLARRFLEVLTEISAKG